MKVLVYHNGECSKCQGLTELLNSRHIDIDYKFYQHEPMTVAELREVHRKLNAPVLDMLRKTEPLFIERYEGKHLTDDEWLQVIVEHPVLLQRPIVILEDKAVIARPPEKLLEIL